MRTATVAICLALFALAAPLHGQRVAPRQEVTLQVRVFSRDSDGDKEKCYDVWLTTLVGRPASCLLGGEDALPVEPPPAGKFGFRLNLLVTDVKEGKVRLETELEYSEMIWWQRQTTRQQMVKTVPIGQPVEIAVSGTNGRKYRLQVRVRDSAAATDD